MNQRADFQKNYLLRYAIIAGALLFFAAYFAYDGFIGYPANLPAARAYDELRALGSEQRIEKWQEIVEQRGWDKSTPAKTAAEIESDISEQYFFGALCLVAGGIALTYYIRSKDSWIESAGEGLATSWGQTVKFADATQLDKKRWAKKGIAKLTYSENGVRRTFVFDDFKFSREPLGQILRRLEASLPREHIVGGPTELETDEQKAKEAEQKELNLEADPDQASSPDSES